MHTKNVNYNMNCYFYFIWLKVCFCVLIEHFIYFFICSVHVALLICYIDIQGPFFYIYICMYIWLFIIITCHIRIS